MTLKQLGFQLGASPFFSYKLATDSDKVVWETTFENAVVLRDELIEQYKQRQYQDDQIYKSLGWFIRGHLIQMNIGLSQRAITSILKYIIFSTIANLRKMSNIDHIFDLTPHSQKKFMYNMLNTKCLTQFMDG